MASHLPQTTGNAEERGASEVAKLVPKMPTQEMIDRGKVFYDYWRGNPHVDAVVSCIWRAMYDAAPVGKP